MPNWLLRLVQMLIVAAVSGAAAAFKWTDNGYLIGLWGIAAAYAFTVVYGWLLDRLASPAARAATAALAREEQEAQRVANDPSILFYPGEFTEDPGPAWIGNQARNLIDVTPEPPALDSLKSLPGPTDPGARRKRGPGSKG